MHFRRDPPIFSAARRPRPRRRLLLALMAWLALLVSDAKALEMIANAALECRSLTGNQARLFFIMRLRQCPDGSPVRVFVLPDDHELHAAFAKTVLGLFPYQLRRVWDRQVYSGTGQAPETLRSEREMLERIGTTPGAIGYAARVPDNSGIKLLEVR